MSDLIIYKDLLIDLFNLSDADIHSIRHENQNGKTLIFVTLVSHPFDCPSCGNSHIKIKGYVDKTITHSALTDRSCIIRYRARRYVCSVCGTTYYERNPFVFNRMKISIFTVQRILEDLKSYHETFSSVARRYHISPTSVISIFEHHVNIPRRPLPRHLNFDEVYAFRSEHSKYACVLLDHDDQIPIDILPSRRLDYLKDYFFKIPLEERRKVEMCCFDMYDPYRTICQKAFPDAIMVVDHFHVIQELNRHLTQIRIAAMKRVYRQREIAKKEITHDQEAHKDFRRYDRQYYVLKKFNWLLFKKEDDPKYFSEAAEAKYNVKFQKEMDYKDLLDEILKSDEELKEAYQLKNEVTYFYEHATVGTALEKLNTLIQWFLNARSQNFRIFAKTLMKWKKEIINSFIVLKQEYYIDADTGEEKLQEKKMTNAIIENKNAIIKCVKKNANGYTNWERFRNRIMYVLDPKATYSLYPIQNENKVAKPCS